MPLAALNFFGLYDLGDLYWDVFVVFAVIIGFGLGVWLMFRQGAAGVTRLFGMMLAGGSALYAWMSWG